MSEGRYVVTISTRIASNLPVRKLISRSTVGDITAQCRSSKKITSGCIKSDEACRKLASSRFHPHLRRTFENFRQQTRRFFAITRYSGATCTYHVGASCFIICAIALVASRPGLPALQAAAGRLRFPPVVPSRDARAQLCFARCAASSLRKSSTSVVLPIPGSPATHTSELFMDFAALNADRNALRSGSRPPCDGEGERLKKAMQNGTGHCLPVGLGGF